jgi:cation diffusion facilitator CzcD-associated flavoprotein CzcO
MIEQKMAKALKHDPILTKRMIPSFSLGCRRLGPGEGFLEAMLEDNVTLATGGVESFTEKGIRTTDGVEHEFDVIICATGFDVSFRPYFPIMGRGGRNLADDWKDEPAAYMAMAAHGFPNFMCRSLEPMVPFKQPRWRSNIIDKSIANAT